MSSKQPRTDLWIDWFFVHFHHIALIGMAAALVIISAVTCQLKHSVTAVEESITEQLRFRPRASSGGIASGELADTSGRHLVYVPAHSHAYGGEGEALLLTVTLSVRNTDLHSHMRVHSIKYFDTNGALLKEFLSEPVALRPLETAEYLVPESDISGGSGANFVVEWSGETDVNIPIIEALMIGASGGQGISFVQRGSAISAGQANAVDPSQP